MQSNNQNSIRYNQKLREEVSLKLCEFLNGLSKGLTAKQKKGMDYVENCFYNEPEIKSWINKPGLNDMYDSLNGKVDIFKEYSNKSKKFKAEKEFENGETKAGRNIYLMMDLNDDIEADFKNQRIKNFAKTKETCKVLSYNLIDEFEKADPYLLTPTTEQEILSMPKHALRTQQIGFGLYDQLDTLEHDPILHDNFKNMQSYYQSNIRKLYETKYTNPLVLLIPPQGNNNLALVSSLYSSQIVEFIEKNFKDVVEFQGTSKELADRLVEFTVGDCGLNNFLKDNQKTRDMINAGLITKNSITKSYFVDKNGNMVRFVDARNNFIDGKLTNGYQKIDLTPAQIQEYNVRKQGVFNEALLVELNIINDKLNAKGVKLSEDEKKLLGPLAEFKNAYRELLAQIEGLTNGLERYGYINNFAANNINLLNSINGIRTDAIYNKKLSHDELNKLNYAKITEKAADLAQKVIEKDLELLSESYPNKDSFKGLLDSKFTNDERIRNKLSGVSSFLSKKEIMESIGFIKDFNQKDAQYQNRWSITKAWYKKSYARMMETRNALIDSLASRGIPKEDLEKIGIDENVNFRNVVVDACDKIIEKQERDIDEIDSYYHRYIEAPKAEVEELEYKKDLVVAKEKEAKEKFEVVRNDLFDVFVKENQDYFWKNPNLKAVDLEKLTERGKRTEIRNKFQDWREKNKEREDVINYNKAYSKYKEDTNKLQQERTEIDEEINARNKCIDKGKLFDKEKFIQSRQNEDKPLEERIKESTDLNNNFIVQKKVNNQEKQIGEVQLNNNNKK